MGIGRAIGLEGRAMGLTGPWGLGALGRGHRKWDMAIGHRTGPSCSLVSHTLNGHYTPPSVIVFHCQAVHHGAWP